MTAITHNKYKKRNQKIIRKLIKSSAVNNKQKKSKN